MLTMHLSAPSGGDAWSIVGAKRYWMRGENMSAATLKPATNQTGAATQDREVAVCALLVARGRLKDGDLIRARRLHEEATRMCFIARSVSFRVEHEPSFD